MLDEPRKHHGFMILMVVVCILTVPFLFVGRTPTLWLGLPSWLWWSMSWTLVLALLTGWGLLHYWKDDDDG